MARKRGVPWDDAPERREFGQRIRKAREDRSMRQDKLAEQCEVSPPYISQIEKGLRLPSDIICRRLTLALPELDETELRLRVLYLKARIAPLRMFWERLLAEHAVEHLQRLPPKAHELIERIGKFPPQLAEDYITVIPQHIKLEEECMRRGMPFRFDPVRIGSAA